MGNQKLGNRNRKEPRHWGVSRAGKRTSGVFVEVQGTALAGGLVSSAQAIEVMLKTAVIRPGLIGQVQNAVFCSDINMDEQPLKVFSPPKGAHDERCMFLKLTQGQRKCDHKRKTISSMGGFQVG